MVDALRSPDRRVRFEAARLLGLLGAEAKAAVSPLIAVSTEPIDLQMSQTKVTAVNWDPACQAAVAIGQIGSSEEVVNALAAILRASKVEHRGIPERRLCAADALGQIGPRAAAAAPALIAAFGALIDSEEEMPGAYSMAVACGRIAPQSESAPEAVAVLIRVLDSRYELARVGAAEALGKFGRTAAPAVQKLGALAADASTEINLRDAAKGAMELIKHP